MMQSPCCNTEGEDTWAGEETRCCKNGCTHGHFGTETKDIPELGHTTYVYDVPTSDAAVGHWHFSLCWLEKWLLGCYNNRNNVLQKLSIDSPQGGSMT